MQIKLIKIFPGINILVVDHQLTFIKENKNFLDEDFILCTKKVLEEYNKIAKETKEFINHKKI